MPSIHETIRTRRTIHDYAPVPVPEEAIQRALEAAHCAPCHKTTWPWRFTRVGPRAREALFALNVRLKGAKAPLDPRQAAKLREKMMDPGALIVASQVVSADPERLREDYAAVACAIQNFSLSLTADGVGSKWGTGGITRHAEAYALLGIDPAVEQIVGFLWVGQPSRPHPAPVRPPLSAHVRTTD
ncbi:MAG: nitroreductase [Alphaproteobacteria bacterium]|nr:nitroreductase [Alphaproteobacteria bacterium]